MLRAFLVLGLLTATEANSDVRIESRYQQNVLDQRVNVDANRWTAYRVDLKVSGTISVKASIANDRGGSGTVFVCDRNAFQNFQAGRVSECRGVNNHKGPISFTYNAESTGSYFVVADNRQSLFSRKTYELEVQVPARFSQQQVAGLRTAFEDIERFIKNSFISPDFDLIMSPCGYRNAFSNIRTGDITICTETLQDASRIRSEGQITGILLHELGHTLLNYWGNPNYRNEETADAFATYLLMAAGGDSMIEEFAQSFETGDPWIEAQHIIETGDTHQISVQRARIIRQNAARGNDFTSRWNRTVYPNLTENGLRMIIQAPGRHGDPQLAQSILSAR